MEYYDSIDNEELYKFYFKKNKDLLTHQEVIDSLDKVSQMSKNDNLKSILFEDKNEFKIRSNNTNNNIEIEEIDEEELIERREKTKSTYDKKTENVRRRIILFNLFKLKVKTQAIELVNFSIKILDEKLHLLNEYWVNEIEMQNKHLYDTRIISQQCSSERRKSSANSNRRNSNNNPMRRTSKIDQTVVQSMKSSQSAEAALLALLEEEENEEKKMDQEIDEFIKKNNEEMEAALLEVKESYREDIEGFEGK